MSISLDHHSDRLDGCSRLSSSRSSLLALPHVFATRACRTIFLRSFVENRLLKYTRAAHCLHTPASRNGRASVQFHTLASSPFDHACAFPVNRTSQSHRIQSIESIPPQSSSSGSECGGDVRRDEHPPPLTPGPRLTTTSRQCFFFFLFPRKLTGC